MAFDAQKDGRLYVTRDRDCCHTLRETSFFQRASRRSTFDVRREAIAVWH